MALLSAPANGNNHHLRFQTQKAADFHPRDKINNEKQRFKIIKNRKRTKTIQIKPNLMKDRKDRYVICADVANQVAVNMVIQKL